MSLSGHFKQQLQADLANVKPILSATQTQKLEALTKDLNVYNTDTYWTACAKLLFLVQKFIEECSARSYQESSIGTK